MAFFAGLAFFDPSTVLPILLKNLGAADWQVGLSRLILVLGFALPSLIAAHRIHNRPLHKNFLIKACALGRIPLLAIPLLLIHFANSRPEFALWSFFIIYAVFWVMDGGCAVSWFDIVGKTMPARYRGRFFGALQTLSGLAAMGAGALVAIILASPQLDFPSDFALLAGLWCAGAFVSQISLFFIREPPGKVDTEQSSSLATYVRSAIPMLRANHRLSKLILARFFLDGAALATPFYVLYARKDLNVSLATVGIYTVVLGIGKIATGPLWGFLSDRYGPVIGFRAVAICVSLAPITVLFASEATVLMILAFFLIGAVQEGLWMTTSTVMLESVPDSERPLVIGVAAMLQTPSALYGVIGGIIAQSTSYLTVFICALVVTATGLAMSIKLPTSALGPSTA